MLLIFSIVIILSGCGKDAPVFPVKNIYEVDLDFNVCGEYKINQKTRMKEHVKDYPIEKCNGVFGFQAEDVPKIDDWIDDMIRYLKKQCS